MLPYLAITDIFSQTNLTKKCRLYKYEITIVVQSEDRILYTWKNMRCLHCTAIELIWDKLCPPKSSLICYLYNLKSHQWFSYTAPWSRESPCIADSQVIVANIVNRNWSISVSAADKKYVVLLIKVKRTH